MSKPRIVIIVAGGKGLRMNADVPKQFLEIKGKPILMHTIETFYNFDNKMQIILVLPESQISYWKDLCLKYSFSIYHSIIIGGETRFHSVKSGLSLIHSPAIVAVHDGVRPFVNFGTLERCFIAAQKFNAAIPVVELIDSIREISKDMSQALDRSKYRLVQTPQVFDAELILDAYNQDFSEFFTDDASVVEAVGVRIHLVEGNRENIKITTDIDLKMAEAFLDLKDS